MLAAFSNERKINDTLEALDCPLSHFSSIAKGVVGKTRLTEALLGGRALEQPVAEKLLAVLDDMAALKHDLPVSPDWSDANRIHALLQARSEILKLMEVGS